MKIVAEFDTKEKVLIVSMDEKKVKDVSEINFFNFGETGGVEMRKVSSSEDDGIITITKILANENGEDIVEEYNENNLTTNLTQALLNRKS